MLIPPRMMISFLRPTTVNVPCSPATARSPLRTQPSASNVARVRSGSAKKPTHVFGPRTKISPVSPGAHRVPSSARISTSTSLIATPSVCRRSSSDESGRFQVPTSTSVDP